MGKGMSTVGMEVSQRLRKWMTGGKVIAMNGKITDTTLALIVYAIATTWVIVENPKLRHTIILASMFPAWAAAVAVYPLSLYSRRAFTKRFIAIDDFHYRFFYKGGHRRSAAAA